MVMVMEIDEDRSTAKPISWRYQQPGPALPVPATINIEINITILVVLCPLRLCDKGPANG